MLLTRPVVGAGAAGFADTCTASPNDNGGPIADDISVAPIPVAGLLLLGALGGLMALRRRKTA